MARQAAITGGVKVEGLREWVKDLQAMGIEVADLKEVFGGIAREAATIAASFAPRRSGTLAASIKGNRAKNSANVKAGSARVPYAGAINYGWSRRNIKGAGFMQKADEVMQPRAERELRAAIDRLIAERNMG